MNEKRKLGCIDKSTLKYVLPDINLIMNDNYICPNCDKSIQLSHIENSWFFKHKNGEKDNCQYYNEDKSNPPGEKHILAQYKLKLMLKDRKKLVFNKKCEHGFLIEKYNILYYDNDKIELEYKFSHEGVRSADVAYLTDTIKYIFEIYDTSETLEYNRPNNIEWFEFKTDDILNIYKTNLNELDCKRKRLHDNCQKCKNNKGVIYFNQMGAGCGKTYQSVKLISEDDTFTDKDIYIYLSKMHSSKNVVKYELEKQEKNWSHLYTLDECKTKQYKKIYYNEKSGKNIKIIIGTIDSFTYSIVKKESIKPSSDYFKSILKSIINDHFDIKIKYAGEEIMLDKKCLIIIDEAQDLGKDYIDAFDRVIFRSNTDLYIIGDKLQSIWDEINTFTISMELKSNVEKSEGVNKVKRFHNKSFMKFVNDIVPFEKYNLPYISEICNGNCDYKHTNTNPVIFNIPKIYNDDYKYDKIDKVINKILNYVSNEINENNYLPENFMFIFPMLSYNAFSSQLETSLQNFWYEKFKDDKYINKILIHNKYWKDKYENYNRHAFIHKSEEGKSINLEESEHCTRILTIHSSKGNGCEVVFLLGISENKLCKYSKIKNNLQYESLLHVAITRQKKSLYIGLEYDPSDDIYKRFKNILKNDDEFTEEPNLSLNINKFTKYDNISNYIIDKELLFEKINSNIIIPNKYNKYLPYENDFNQSVDYGHHIIRYYVMWYYFMYNMTNNEKIDISGNRDWKDQFYNKIKDLSNKKPFKYDYKNYYSKLREISKNNRISKYKDNKEIPIFDNFKYSDILILIIDNIQNKIKNVNVLKFCSLECIILIFIIKLLDDGYYSNITIIEIYDIINHYNCCSDYLNKEHSDKYNCKCFRLFNESKILNSTNQTITNSISISIKKHHDLIKNMENIYNNYYKYISDILLENNFKYNIFHRLYLLEENINFTISNEHDIIAYSEKYVIHFILKPQFNELNFNDIILKSIFDDFMIMNVTSTTNNYNRYIDKKIYTCIITLDSTEPIMIESVINKDNIYIKESIYSFLYDKYNQYHEPIYDYYQYIKKDEMEVIDKLKNELKNKNKNIPNYILEYFTGIKSDFKRHKNIEIFNEINDKDIFITKINENLKEEITKYLNIE